MKSALILILLTACSAAKPAVTQPGGARVTRVLTEEDLENVQEPAKEELGGLCGEASSLIRGSFTRPRADQEMLSVREGTCGEHPRNLLVILEEGREVWRGDGAPAVRAMDIDGDGQDEWLKLWKDCRGEECRTEAWLARAGGDIIHVEGAEERYCGATGMIRWTSVSVLVKDGVMKVATGEHWKKCGQD
jgi:hypothetical protein